MSKYIDADQIRAEIKRHIHILRSSIMSQGDYGQSCQIVAYENILSFLDTIPEQPVEKQEQPVSPKDKFVFPNFLYARTVDNKTIDVSYVPQSLNAVEYVKNNPTEQSMEGLEEEYVRFAGTDHHKYQDLIGNGGIDLARHFAEWGAEHLKK